MKQCISLYKADIVFINETHFNDDILDAEIAIDGYMIFRKDRDFSINNDCRSDHTSNGGGSIIYVKCSVNASKVDSFIAPDSVAVEIETSIGKVNLACIYRSQSLNVTQNNCMLQAMAHLSNQNEESIIVGDFNLPNVSWVTGTVDAPWSTTNKSLVAQKKFMEFVHNNGLVWSISNEITRRRVVDGIVQESTLDQILCTNDAIISDFNIISPLGKSDHVCFNIDLNVYSGVRDNDIFENDNVKVWGKIHPHELLSLSNDINWNFSKDELPTENMWEELHGKLTQISDTVPTRTKSNNMPWSNSALKRNRKSKDKMWAKFDLDPTTENFNIALSKQGQYELCEVSAKVKYERKITNILKSNCKPFYSYLRSKRVLKTCVGTLNKPDGSTTTDATETAEVFADAFSSVFVNEPYGPLDSKCYNLGTHDQIEDIVIYFDDVQKELQKLDISKSQGPDDIHPKLLKSLSSSIGFVSAVTNLFQKCALTCTIPSKWKEANVIALFKKGCKKEPLNYRPVSLTCILCKLYEKLLRRHILKHIEGNIIGSQHGFVEKKSCLSNLLETVETILNILDEGAPVDVFYFDFCKAFDSVPHYRLLTKMESMGISGKTLNIIADFLSGRSLRTCVGGCLSSSRRVRSGVPQGSVLGPLLFVMFINDLPDGLNGVARLFADDLKLIVDASNTNSVNHDIRILQEWESLWLLKFNPTKCKVMHLNYNSNPLNEYSFNGVVLESIEKEKDLGVTTTSSLFWNEQIKACLSKANKMISWVTRNLILRDKTVMLNVYKTIIRPHLEYCTQLWSPVAGYGNWSMILELEGVQRRFTRLIDDIGTLPYSQRLDILKLTTLAERRIRGDLIEAFKIINNIVEYGQNVFELGRSGSNILSRPSSNTDSKIRKLKNSFISERVIPYWNKLPIDVKHVTTVNSFKIALDVFKRNNLLMDTGNFWEVSDEVLNRIEGPSYLSNKKKHNEYLFRNPIVARKRGINLYIK